MCDALQAEPADIPAMSGALRWLSIGLTKELDKIKEDAVHSLPIAIGSTAVKPYFDSTVQHLPQLRACIDQIGAPLVRTYSREEPQVPYSSFCDGHRVTQML